MGRKRIDTNKFIESIWVDEDIAKKCDTYAYSMDNGRKKFEEMMNN